MSISGPTTVTATSRVTSTAAEAPPVARTVAQTNAAAGPGIDALTQQPAPLRFPWLSRLSQQLEHAAGQKAAFAPAPVLGDHVDRSA